MVLIFNFQKRLHPAFALVGMPYDGAWTVRFDGDSAAYSELYGDGCAAQLGRPVAVAGGRATVCVPEMALLVLTRA